MQLSQELSNTIATKVLSDDPKISNDPESRAQMLDEIINLMAHLNDFIQHVDD
jgi:hypothetical protein